MCSEVEDGCESFGRSADRGMELSSGKRRMGKRNKKSYQKNSKRNHNTNTNCSFSLALPSVF